MKPNTSVVERVTPPQNVLDAINERMKPGMVFVTTDLPATPDTRTGKDFRVMDAPAADGLLPKGPPWSNCVVSINGTARVQEEAS